MTRTVPSAAEGEAPARAGLPRLALRKSLARLSVRPRSILILSVIPLVAIGFGIWGWTHDWVLGVDSAVYRAGALTLLHGQPLYDANTLSPEPWWALLPFTYPPTAALLFVPLAVVPTQVAWGFLTAISLGAMALSIRIAIGALPRPADDGPRWWASPARSTIVFSLVFLGLEPVWRTIFLGQINLILMAMILLDMLVLGARGSRWGGVLVGVAAAIKLTPLVFLAHLFITGRRKDAVRGLVTFVLMQALMFLVNPHDAFRYWTSTLPDTGRIGPVHWAGNQSLNALMNRATDLAPWASKAAMGIGLLLAIPALWLLIRFHRRGQALAALLVTAFWTLLISPISWTHHWVWVVPLIVLLVSRLPKTTPATAWKRWVGTGLVAFVFISCVLLILPNGRNVELHWKVWQNVLGDAYILMPVVLALALILRWGLQRRSRSAGSGPVTGPAGGAGTGPGAASVAGAGSEAGAASAPASGAGTGPVPETGSPWAAVTGAGSEAGAASASGAGTGPVSVTGSPSAAVTGAGSEAASGVKPGAGSASTRGAASPGEASPYADITPGD